MNINFASKHNKTMKKVLILLALPILFIAGANAQREQANWNAASYYAYDTTTFILGAAKGVKFIYADFTTLDANDAILEIGAAGADMEGCANLAWTGSTVSPDSVVLDSAAHTKTIRMDDGTRYTTTRAYFWFENGIPSDFIAITIRWGSVTSGRLKLYF